jgi:hypothetical protein
MNVVHYRSRRRSNTAYIIVDRTMTYQSGWIIELIKNISDFNISNIFSKHYDVIVGLDEDSLLKYACDQKFLHAVVLSTGTDFINGESFFLAVENLITQNYFLAGHILDRKEAYYELHHQCYVINLEKYGLLERPCIGQLQLGESHWQNAPVRSTENIHDDYTPISITGGNDRQNYRHKLHGWNILSKAFDNNEPVIVFDDSFRNNKKYYYPEDQKDFLKNIQWAYSRERYCANEFVHIENTEYVDVTEKDFDCIITPASGTWFLPFITKQGPAKVIYYDYNQNALDYWKIHAPKIGNVTYEFVKIDLLGMCDYDSIFNKCSGKTLFSISNIFCYEGTSMMADLSYRLHKENELLKKIPDDFYLFFNSRSCIGFLDIKHKGRKLETVKISKLLKPTWHINQDWI